MLEKSIAKLTYRVDGRREELKGYSNLSNSDLDIVIKKSILNDYGQLTLKILPRKEIIIEELQIEFENKYTLNDKVFVNGYQSWTDSREFGLDEKIPSISSLAGPVMKKYQFDKYGDYSFWNYSKRKGDLHGFTYSYIRNKQLFTLIGSLTEEKGYTIIQHKTDKNRINIHKECKDLIVNKEYQAFDIVLIKGKEKEVFDKYFELMEIERPKVKPMTGWTSWYNYYQDISENIILENLESYHKKEIPIDIFQVDDGFQTYVGDWLDIDYKKFPNGMKIIADKIKEKNYLAGLWLAPFVVESESRIFKEKKDWLLKDDNGNYVEAGSNWSTSYVLDFYNNEVRDYLIEVFDTVLNKWGFDMVKLDFLYGVCLLPRKYKTRGQIMTEAMEFLREIVGEKLILGCGVPLGPAFGKVDYCRIGCDVGLDWNDKWYMKYLHRERISTLNSIKNAIGRRQLDGRAFLNDPDVFLLRDDNIELSETEKNTLSAVNYLFGSLLFTSDNLSKYSEVKEEIIKDIYTEKKVKIKEVIENEGIMEILFEKDRKKMKSYINFSNIDQEISELEDYKKEIFLGKKDNKIHKNNRTLIKKHEMKIFTIN